MLEIVYLKESTWQSVWAWLRFQTTVNHVGVMLDGDRYIHLSYSGVKISKLRDKKHIMYTPYIVDNPMPKSYYELQARAIMDKYLKGYFKHIKLTKHRLIVPFLGNPSKDHMLCNEFVDYLLEKFIYEKVDSLAIARKID